MLLGVCVGPAKPGGADAFETLSLQPMPLYAVPSDNVVMTCAATSGATGRIFLGGADGHLYELTYAATDGWRRRRCAKTRVTGGLQQLLPGFLPPLLFGAPEPLERLAVDDERGVLYTLAANGAIAVFDLGANGDEAPRKVAEVADFVDAAARAAQGGQPVFRLGGDRRGSQVKCIAPIRECLLIFKTLLSALSSSAAGCLVLVPVVPPLLFGHLLGQPSRCQR